MSKKTTLERAYLHINNGGLSFSVVERTDIRKDDVILPPDWSQQKFDFTPEGNKARDEALAKLPRQDMHNRRWILQIETNHFGTGVKFNFPLVPVVIKWLIWSLQRVLARMETPQGLPTDGFEYALRDEEMYVDVVDGQPAGHQAWPDPRPRYAASSDGSASAKKN